MVPLGTRLVLLLVMFFSSLLLSPTIINVTFAIDMPDAPVTQDTVTAGWGEEDNNDEEMKIRTNLTVSQIQKMHQLRLKLLLLERMKVRRKIKVMRRIMMKQTGQMY